ncbi:MAG: DUF4837 family protein [Paludibacteraceae bacterium]|nr:DUF4837 family protein [Paludibacteraceae bacterium]
MKNIITSLISFSALFSALLLSSCGGVSTKPNITGRAFEVLVVIDDSIAKSAVGDSLFGILNQDVPCMPQSEPYFNISKTPHRAFSDILKPARNIIIVNVGDLYSRVKLSNEENKWATTQSVMTINGPDIESVASAIGKYEKDIINYFVKSERKRSISYQSHYPEAKAMERVKEKFGFTMVVPKGFNRFKEADDFMWISNSSNDVRQNLVIYTYPYNCTEAFTREMILHKRDSVMMINIPGPSEDSYMGTEYKFEPPLFYNNALESGDYAAEVRGLWTVIGDIMGGPFVSVTCLDKEQNRVVTAEAFIYAPNQYKRNIMRQLESILYTIKFNKDNKNGQQD